MSLVGTPQSARREQVELSRLAWAFVLSLMLHLMVFGAFQTGKKLGWWQRVHWPTWIQARKPIQKPLHHPQEPAQQEIPLIFVEVTPQQATPEPPKEAKYYSTQNSKAENKQADQDTTVPKIDGTRPELAKTEEVPREKFVPLQPAPAPAPTPPTPQVKEPQEELKPAPTSKPGDLTLAKPDPNPPKKAEGEAKQERPKTVQEAKARQQQANQLPGHKMKQEGGVRRPPKLDSLDAKATPFGYYDSELVRAIQKAWYALLDEQGYAADHRGKVMLRFRLHYDGTITDLTIVENTAGWLPGAICETAIEKPKPYSRFPAEMRRVVGDIRSIQFTFFYD
jgi:hypothetical protein